MTIDELRAAKRWAELAKALEAKGTIDANVECAQIFRDRLAHRLEEAKAWERVLMADPDHAVALDGLEALAVLQCDWSRLATIFEMRASKVADPRPYLERALAIYRDELADDRRVAAIEARLAKR